MSQKDQQVENGIESPIMEVNFPEDMETLEDVDFDQIIEEVNILDLEGFIFAFDPRNKGLRVGKHSFDLGEGRELTLNFSGDHGQPSWMAYRVLQAIFKKITDDGCTDDGYPNMVSFSERAMGKDLGMSGWGGKQSLLFKEAVEQLNTTRITIKVANSGAAKPKSKKQWIEVSFYIAPRVRYAGVDDRIEACALWLDDEIIKSLNKKYWVKFDYNHLKALEPAGMVMYKRLYRYFMSAYSRQLTVLKREGRLSTENISRARKSVTFSKMYVDIISTWFGGDLVVRDRPAHVKRQLGGHLQKIQATGLIRSWKVEKAKDGGMKIVFQPGMGFFRTYEQLWLSHNHQPQLPFTQSAGLVEISQPLQAIEYFYEHWFGIEESESKTYPKKQFEYAQQLVSLYGYEAVTSFIDYAIKQAKSTKFDMATFNAIQVYEGAWKAQRSKEVVTAQRMAERRAQELENDRRERYESFCRTKRYQYQESLSEEEIEDLQEQAESLCLVEHPGSTGVVRKAAKSGAFARLISEAVALPTYEEWCDQQ